MPAGAGSSPERPRRRMQNRTMHAGRNPVEQGARGERGRFGPRGLAARAIARPRLVLAVWGLIALVGIGLIGAFLGSALSPESDITSNPDSKRARELIEDRLPARDEVDEVVIVSSERFRVGDRQFQ